MQWSHECRNAINCCLTPMNCDCRDAMAVFAMEAASVISERSLEISFASALSTVSASGLNINAGNTFMHMKFSLMTLIWCFCTMLLSLVSAEWLQPIRCFCTMLLSLIKVAKAKLQAYLVRATWNIAGAQSGFLFASLPNLCVCGRSVTDKSTLWQCDVQPSLLVESETPCLSAPNNACCMPIF